MAGTDFAVDYTLPAVLRHKAPDGSYMEAINVLSGQYPLLEEGYWIQANDDTSHEFLRMSQEPSGSLVRLNEGTAFEAAGTAAVREQLARMESMLKIDVRVLEKSPDPVRYIQDMKAAHMRGMIKQWTKIMFATRDSSSGPWYGDMDRDPKSVNGLIKSLSALTTVSSPVDNVRSFGSAAANVNTSIFLVKWGPKGLFCLYPKTADRSLRIHDLPGEQLVYDKNNKPYTAFVSNFAWEFGLGIGDERAVQRLANITVSGAATDFGGADGSSVAGENAMIEMIERLPDGDASGAVFYVAPQIMTAIRKRLNSKSNLYFTPETVWGRPQITFNGIPVVRCDALNTVEAVVS